MFTFVSDAEIIRRSGRHYREYEGVYLHVGYAKSKSEMISSARSEIMKLPQKTLKNELLKNIRFKPAARPVLKSLHQHLLAWDTKQQHPEKSDPEICDIAGLEINLPYDPSDVAALRDEGSAWEDLDKANQRAKALAVQRHLRIAQQYIDNVVKGQFPLRTSR